MSVEVMSIARCPHPKVRQSEANPEKGTCEACGKAMVRKKEWRYVPPSAIRSIDTRGE